MDRRSARQPLDGRHITVSSCAGALLLLLPIGAHAAEDAPSTSEAPRLLVLDFSTALGVDAELAKALEEMFVTRLHALGRHEVMAMADVASLLDLERQRQLLDCPDDSCMAEIGGAVGARFLVAGKLAALGTDTVLTLKLMDTRTARLTNHLSEPLPSAREQFPEAVRQITYRLLGEPVPELARPTPWYKNGWLWGWVATVAAGSAALWWLARPAQPPDAALGTYTLDAR